jgi:hypothetical protein
MRTIYEANDGSHFDSSQECQQHDLQTKLSKYKNYRELYKNVYNFWCDYVDNTTYPNNTLPAFVIDNIELLNTMITADLKQIDNSKKFNSGQTILVRLCTRDDWEEKVFVRYDPRAVYPYVCENGEDDIRHWGLAKSL